MLILKNPLPGLVEVSVLFEYFHIAKCPSIPEEPLDPDVPELPLLPDVPLEPDDPLEPEEPLDDDVKPVIDTTPP